MTIADTTRSKTAEECIKKLDGQLQNHIADSKSKFDELNKKMDFVMEKLIPSQEGILGAAPGIQGDLSHANGFGGRTRGNETQEWPYGRAPHTAKFEIPYFDDVDPCS